MVALTSLCCYNNIYILTGIEAFIGNYFPEAKSQGRSPTDDEDYPAGPENH